MALGSVDIAVCETRGGTPHHGARENLSMGPTMIWHRGSREQRRCLWKLWRTTDHIQPGMHTTTADLREDYHHQKNVAQTAALKGEDLG